MTKNKKRTITILSIVLVAVIIAGGTLAYLFTKTDPETNVFTFADNIRADLTEPNWDPEEAENLVPGKKIEKDPIITNTSLNAVDEYAAIKLSFQKGNGDLIDDEEKRDITGAAATDGMTDMQRLLTLIEIDWSNNWTLSDGTEESNEQVYVFNKILPQNVKSDPVFYSVTIKETVTPEDLLWLAGNFGHERECYEFGEHDDAICTIEYRHHEKCAIHDEAGNEAIEGGGELNGKTCDCETSVIHDSKCPSLMGTIKDGCGHDTLISGLGNFNIMVEGAVVQADVFESAAAAAADLVSLFS